MNTASVTDHWQKCQTLITSRFASSKEDALDFVKTYESWHKPPIFIIFSFLRSIRLNHSSPTPETYRNFPILRYFTRAKKGLHGLAAWWFGVLPSITRVWRMPASLQAPGKAAQAASKTAKCLGMTTLKDMLIWLEGLDTTLQPVSFSMVFSVPRSSKFFQGTKHWCPSTEH